MTSHSSHGIYMRNLKEEDFPPPENVSSPHRDDHFLFFFQECGENQLVVDSQTINAEGRKVFCILPGQVHHVVKFDPVDAWFVAVAIELVPEHVRVLLQQAVPLQAADVNERWAVKLNTAVSLLQLHLEEPSFTQDSFHVIKAATDSVLSMFAAIYREQAVQATSTKGRAGELTRKFKALLQQQYKTIKRPAAYAAMLNVSPAYLNEVVNETTGMSVSKCIHQEILLEAKRMLFYTTNTIREISLELGYEDHTYFTRLFSKQEGLPPSKYRLARG